MHRIFNKLGGGGNRLKIVPRKTSLSEFLKMKNKYYPELDTCGVLRVSVVWFRNPSTSLWSDFWFAGRYVNIQLSTKLHFWGPCTALIYTTWLCIFLVCVCVYACVFPLEYGCGIFRGRDRSNLDGKIKGGSVIGQPVKIECPDPEAIADKSWALAKIYSKALHFWLFSQAQRIKVICLFNDFLISLISMGC